MDVMLLTSTGVSDYLTDVSTIFNSAVTMITGNPVAAVFVGVSLVSAGIALFRKVTRRRA